MTLQVYILWVEYLTVNDAIKKFKKILFTYYVGSYIDLLNIKE